MERFRPFVAARLELARARHEPLAALEQRRLRRFRRLVGFLQDHSPYYQRVIEERGIRPADCVPEDFPVLTKRAVMENFDEIVTDPRVTLRGVLEFLDRSRNPSDRYLDRYVVLHTSGTSGERALFLFDPRGWARGMAPAADTGGLKLFGSRRRVAFIGLIDGHFAGVSLTGSARDWPMRLLFDFAAFEVNQPIGAIIDGLNSFQPDVVVSYASALRGLADAKLDGRLRIAPQALNSSGEAILAMDRTIIEKAFGPRLTNMYACTEFMFIGVQGPGSPTMRLFENDLFIETESDHTLVTNTANRILPLIRYRLDDVLVPVEAGEAERRFDGIVGRKEQSPSFVNPDGKRDWVRTQVVNELPIPHARRFQMRVTAPDRFRFLLELEDGLDSTQTKAARLAADRELHAALAAKGLTNVTFTVELVDSIPVDRRTGKFKLIVMDQGSGIPAPTPEGHVLAHAAELS